MFVAAPDPIDLQIVLLPIHKKFAGDFVDFVPVPIECAGKRVLEGFYYTKIEQNRKLELKFYNKI